MEILTTEDLLKAIDKLKELTKKYNNEEVNNLLIDIQFAHDGVAPHSVDVKDKPLSVDQLYQHYINKYPELNKDKPLFDKDDLPF